jgi:hypothetical protein
VKNTFVIEIDEEASAFMADQGVTDPALYVQELLQKAMRRDKHGEAGSQAGAINNAAPDTSGYPEMKAPFKAG